MRAIILTAESVTGDVDLRSARWPPWVPLVLGHNVESLLFRPLLGTVTNIALSGPLTLQRAWEPLPYVLAAATIEGDLTLDQESALAREVESLLEHGLLGLSVEGRMPPPFIQKVTVASIPCCPFAYAIGADRFWPRSAAARHRGDERAFYREVILPEAARRGISCRAVRAWAAETVDVDEALGKFVEKAVMEAVVDLLAGRAAEEMARLLADQV
jgi:hypothetical protein